MVWYDTLANSTLKSKTTLAVANNSVTYTEILDILETAAIGGITASEFSDLQLVATNCKAIFASTYVAYVTEATVSGNPGNDKWWGGATTIGGVSLLGNMAVGTSELNANRLIDKWFMGLDRPMPIAGGDTAAGLSAQFVGSYTLGTGPLFVNGASAADINQGYAGTCYLVATMGAIAKANPSLITNMFTDNGNGTYGVKFYFDGKPVYTTVDKSVPVYNGSIAFSGNASGSTSGELWVPLLEKAYAQLNSQFNLDGDDYKEASYQAIEGGLAYTIKQLTGLNYKYYSSYYTGISDPYDSGFYTSTNTATYKQTIINALNAGSIGWLGSWGATFGANGKKEFVAGHAYMLLGYNAATDKFIVRNPWGDTTTGNYNAQFEVSIGTFWNSSVKGIVALSDATVTDPTYTYTLTSSAASTTTAVTEGGAVTFTITRNSIGTASTVYVVTRAGTATTADFAALSKTAVTFDANEYTKTVTVNTFTDSLTEGSEFFYLDLYDNLTDTTRLAYKASFIQDKAAQAFTYTVTSANTPTNGAVEGNAVTFTVTRSGSGSQSTVYLSTRGATAGALDFASQQKTALTFAAYETSKTFTVNTFTDSLTEGTEGFYLDLYKYYADVTASATGAGYIQDKAVPTYTFSMTSSAPSSGTAVAEGGKITFTITRSATGSAASVYLSTMDGTANASDYVGFTKKQVTFLANQSIATVDVELSKDWWLETTEYFQVKLFKNYADTTASASAYGCIKDAVADAYNYTVTSSTNAAAGASEGDAVTFTITRNTSGSTSTVYLSTTPGSANGTDYGALDKMALSFAANETVKTVTVNTYTDSLTEGTEYFYLDLFKNYSDTSFSAFGTGYIKDKATANYTYTVSTSATYANATTEGDAITFTITRSGSGVASTVYLSTTASSATASDYAALDKWALNFAAYETTKTVTINTYTDSLTEGTETFFLDLFKNYSDPTYTTYATGYIKDKAVAGYNYTISTSAASSTSAATEGDGITFTITRSSSGSVSTVYLSTVSGSANDTDFGELEKSAVTFAANETVKTVTINTYTDSVAEGAEYFYVDLYKSFSDLSYSTFATAYIKDKVQTNYNYTVSSSASSSYTAATEGNAITFTITRSGTGSTSTVYVSTTAATAGTGDYAALDKWAVTFASYETTKTVTVNTYTDSLSEGAEYFFLDLYKNYSDTYYSSYGTGYVKDNTVANYTYTVSSAANSTLTAVSEGSAVTFTITRSGTGAASTVYLSTSYGSAGGNDYASLYKTAVTFGAYETTKTVTVNTFTDGLTEGAEYFYAELYKNYSDTTYAAYGYAYIKDQATQAYNYTVTSSAGTSASAVSEGSAITFTITRSATGSSSTVYVSTTSGSAWNDYSTLTKSAVTFAANETTKTVTVNTYTDSTVEGTEYFYLDLFKNYSDANFTTYASGYIKDAATANFNYTVTSSHGYSNPVTEGNAITFTITRSGTGAASTVYLSTTDSSAGSADRATLNKWALSFGASETTKTVTINTYTDSLSEGTELFFLDLFKTYSDTYFTTYASGYIKDPGTTLASGVRFTTPLAATPLLGSANSDVLIGNAANDTLIGGGGADTLTGGTGADTFQFQGVGDAGDTIIDFRTEEGDKLVFSSSNFGSLPAGALGQNFFAANSRGIAVDGNSRFLFNTSNGVLGYDADGTGSGAAVTIATLNTRSLSASSIFIAAS